METKTTKLGLDFCPVCKSKLDSATSFDDAVPNPGDITICIVCASVLEYSEDMSLIEANKDIINSLPTQFKEQIRILREAVITL